MSLVLAESRVSLLRRLMGRRVCCVRAVFTNNAMVIPTAVYALNAALHTVATKHLPRQTAHSVLVSSLRTVPERVVGHLQWQHVFVKVASIASMHLTLEGDRRLSLFRDKSGDFAIVPLLLEEVCGGCIRRPLQAPVCLC